MIWVVMLHKDMLHKDSDFVNICAQLKAEKL